MPTPDLSEHLPRVLPADGDATLVGRLWDPGVGPCVVALRDGQFHDLTPLTATVSDLLERPDRLSLARTAPGASTWPAQEVLANSLAGRTEEPHLLAPVDLQVLKAAGVTFVRSMVERVVEERAGGDPTRAQELRHRLEDVVGGAISSVVPGTAQAHEVELLLRREGLWSQYLEVGLGPDPEIFTKAPVLSAVGVGAAVGVLERSTWNNPEPELVLVATSTGEAVAATLGNDVNLRDVEGRSALLLGHAKDNNASCSIGPLLRLFDEGFDLAAAGAVDVDLQITGPDGFTLRGRSSVGQISRPLADLLRHTAGAHHDYPDGFVLFTGTMFAPTTDRHGPGSGFTHHRGDVVAISSPPLGTLVNSVDTAEDAPPWTFGISALMANLARRALL